MGELVGDICKPSEFLLPQHTTTSADALSGSLVLSGAMIFNKTLGKAEVWVGGGWETITSVGR